MERNITAITKMDLRGENGMERTITTITKTEETITRPETITTITKTI